MDWRECIQIADSYFAGSKVRTTGTTKISDEQSTACYDPCLLCQNRVGRRDGPLSKLISENDSCGKHPEPTSPFGFDLMVRMGDRAVLGAYGHYLFLEAAGELRSSGRSLTPVIDNLL